MQSLYLATLFLALFCFRVRAFNHPGLLVNNGDITRIKSKLSVQLDPWQASWDKLISIRYSQSDYVHNAVAVVSRNPVDGVAANADLLWHDAAAAFNLALRWKVEGNMTYAATASGILGAWGRTLTGFAGNDDQYLLAGLQGYQLVNAAELLRDYIPFQSSGDAQAFTTMFQATFLQKNTFFLNHQAPSQHNHKHFHANWELCNLASVMAFGIYTDNSTLYDFAVSYFKNGTGNGAINNAITNLVKEPGTEVVMGQPQEAGRDQGHTSLDFQLLGVIAQQAWNQGEDLYSYNNSRILQGAEYFARYNLGNEVPFVPWTNNIVSWTAISPSSRGAYRPTWELLYAHYAQIKGLEAPWTELFKNYTITSFQGFEGGAGSYGEGSGHYDGLGWGSLLYHLDEDDVLPLLPHAANTSSTSTALSIQTPLPAPTVSPVIFSAYTSVVPPASVIVGNTSHTTRTYASPIVSTSAATAASTTTGPLKTMHNSSNYWSGCSRAAYSVYNQS